MVSDHYELKHSRLSIVFQLSFVFMMSIVLFQLSHLWVWGLLTLASVLILILFRRQERVIDLQYLDQDQWSIRYQNNPKIHRVHIREILDHRLYVVIYFKEKKEKNLVIWRDQVPLLAWKRLLMRAKLG